MGTMAIQCGDCKQAGVVEYGPPWAFNRFPRTWDCPMCRPDDDGVRTLIPVAAIEDRAARQRRKKSDR